MNNINEKLSVNLSEDIVGSFSDRVYKNLHNSKVESYQWVWNSIANTLNVGCFIMNEHISNSIKLYELDKKS